MPPLLRDGADMLIAAIICAIVYAAAMPCFSPFFLLLISSRAMITLPRAR